jgi:hypothetical protein
VDAREARAEDGSGAFGVGDGGEVAGKELAGETGDWGFFEACEDGGGGGAVASDEDDVCVAFGVPGESLCDSLATSSSSRSRPES